VSDLAAQRQINRGYDDGLARAIEFVLTPLVLGAIGFGLDAWLGTRPLFTISLGVLGVVGIFVKMWLGYDREMRGHEAEGAWRGSPAERERAAGEAPAAAAVAELSAVRRPSARAEAEAPPLSRPGYISAIAAGMRFFRNQATTPHGVVPGAEGAQAAEATDAEGRTP
jgi:hypothetical protein